MKEYLYKICKRKNIFLIIAMVLCMCIIVVKVCFFYESPSAFLLRENVAATEVLHQEKVTNKEWLVFFMDETGFVSCAVIEKNLVSYDVLRISGKMLPTDTNYICSSFLNEGNRRWIDWGIITDENIVTVEADGKQMHIIENMPYGYKIGWLLGSGVEPQNHVEIVKETERE